MDKLSIEIYNNDVLVEKYLNNSTTSFIISIIALIVTMILSGFQIYQNWKIQQNKQNELESLELSKSQNSSVKMKPDCSKD